MKGIKWALKHTFLTLIGKKKNLLDGSWGTYPSKWVLIKNIWRMRNF